MSFLIPIAAYFMNLNSRFFILITLSIIGLTWFLHWKKKNQHLINFSSKIPPPKNMSYFPIIGHAHHFIGDTERILQSILKFSSTSVYPMTAYLAHRIFHTIIRPEDMEIILNSNKTLAKDDLYRFSIPLAGNGIFNLEVKTWRKHRKIIAPTLNQKILDDFVPIFAEQCSIMTNLLDTEIENKFDIFQFISKCSMDCVLETSMGVKFNCQTKDLNKIEEKINRGLEILMMRMFNVVYQIDFIYNLTSVSREEKRIVNSFKRFINKVVYERKREFIQNKMLSTKQPKLEVIETKSRNTFLDHLIKLSVDENKFTDEEITNEVRTYVIAASDTSATVTAFTLTCIAMFPDIQQKVFDEIMDVVGWERNIEYTDLPKFKYMDMVIKETMRIFPLAPVIVRKVKEDLQLETCTLAKDVGLVLCILTLHRCPLYFKHPLKFIPERFSLEESAKRHPYSYLPFSGGPRNCIGPKYGMMLTKCMLTATIRKYLITTEYKDIEDIRIKQSLILKPVLGFKVNLIERENCNFVTN